MDHYQVKNGLLSLMYTVAAPRYFGAVVSVQCKHQPVLSAVHHIEKDIERHGKLKANTEDEQF